MKDRNVKQVLFRGGYQQEREGWAERVKDSEYGILP
jgi:hypothetical protein